ncbi:MAG: hypothetical protein CBD08_005390 [Cellvibrionales bacterium TMED148]|nr:hypothetical protein [Porticoccaceae bacterium]RPG89973.1 MAG: hypothetical protein CBD08_005390 [Cellvibrionales bacterium TMED148]
MGNSSKEIQKVVSGIATSSKHCLTEAGHPKTGQAKADLIDAINQAFALFQINYHNQYFSAFADNKKSEDLAKKLWLSKLGIFSSDTICKAAEKIISENEYLPTLYIMIEACKATEMPAGVPTVREAYIEACIKPSPKVKQIWSSPIVYLSGRDSGWYLLAHTPEYQALPIFTTNYQSYCKALLKGKIFEIDRTPDRGDPSPTPASEAFLKEQLKKLKDLLD